MWRSFWRSVDRFSLQHFKCIVNELREIKLVDDKNRDPLVDLLQSIVEIVTYGDSHDPLIFECFMEYQVLAEFVRLLKISGDSSIEAPLLQYLSIMIQNIQTEHAIYYCLSNDYINNIITHCYEFSDGDLAYYYVSLLRVISGKITRETLCLLVKTHQQNCRSSHLETVISFPLYTEALKFAHHEEKMIQTAIRTVTLNIYNVCDDMVYQFITTPPVSDYFSDLVHSLRKRCFHLDKIVHDKKEAWNLERRSKLVLESDEITNDLYYFQDMLSVGEPRLRKIVTQNIFSLLVFPTLLPSLYLRDTNDMNKCISATTSLYLLSQLIQILKGTNIIHFICALFLYIPIFSSMKESIESVAADTTNQTHVFERYVSELDQMVQLQCDGANDIRRNLMLKQLLECMSSNSGFISFSPGNMLHKSDGIIHNVCSNSHCLMVASLKLLVGLLESKDIDPELAAITAIPEIKSRIRKVLLEVLASRTSVQLQLEAAWVLWRLLLVSADKNLEDTELQLFKTSFELSTEHLKKELDGCWFDYIHDTLKNEWTSCKKALEQPLQYRDPFFVLELSFDQNAASSNLCSTSALAWQHMVDAVKGFIIHHQLKSYIFSGYSFDNALANLKDSFSRETNGSDLSRASFGSELSLGSAIPCKIAFSKTRTRDVYMMPLETGRSGKLILLEPHPLYSRKGVVIAIAPLAGLNLSIVENQPTWLLLRLRDIKPRFSSIETRGHDSNPCFCEPGSRWILGFPDAQVCNTAYAMVLKEISKQRSVAEGMLTMFLQNIPP